ncbi:MAG: alpha/beta fold hydrolase [Gammaproteobacteria bacterium]|nr:alpha/beta fold hydrolase [Gammaproteobacteria bacterium]
MQLNALERGEGPPIILLHGLFGSAANLGIVARGLAPHFTTWSLDVRNHGHSPHADSMSYPEMAADVLELMDAHDIISCPVLGHSMGGKIAMQLALDHPDRVSKLVVADVAPVTYPPHHHNILKGLAAVEEADIDSRSQADALLAATVPEASVRAFLLKSLQKNEQGKYRWLLNRAAISDNYQLLGTANQGQAFDGSVLFIKGGDSDYILPEHQAAVLGFFPQAELKVIAGTGHWLHAEKPAIFNKLVLRFLLR